MKLINTRVPLFLAVAFILGIYSCYELSFGDFYFGLVVALLVVGLIVFSAVKRYGVWKIAVVMLVFVLLGFGLTQLSLQRMASREIYGETVRLTGRVSDINRNTSTNGTYYLEDCALDTGEKLSGRVEFRYYGKQLQTGDVVTVSGNLHSTYPVKANVEAYLIRDKINYKLSDVELLSRQSGALKLDEKIRKYIYDTTSEYMPKYGGVMYALLTGDRGAVSVEVNYAFSRAGILHLLAVSGLHVGFIVTLICFALRRLRLPPLLECAIITVPLLFYAYVCAFTPSVVRAIVMVVCSYVARACLGRYDMLSSMSWAALLILLVRPLYLFDVGFQLSFLSVYGIATMYSCIDRRLKRRNMHRFVRYIVNSMLISLSCIAATLFTVAINFGEVPVFSALLNIVVIPIVSVVFTMGIVGLIPWVFHYLLFAADYVLRFVVVCASAVAKLSFATVALYAVALSTVIAVVALFVMGGFINITKKGKRIVYCACAALIAVSTVLSVVPKATRDCVFVTVSDGSAVVAAVSDSGEGAIVMDFNDYDTVVSAVNFLRRYRLKSCTVYVSDCSGVTDSSLDALARLPVSEVHLLSAQSNDMMEEEFKRRGVSVLHQLPNSTTGNHITVRSYFDATLSGARLAVRGMEIVVSYNGDWVVDMVEKGFAADVFVLSDWRDAFANANIVTVTPRQSNAMYNYGANKYGNFTIEQKGDTIILRFR